MIELSIDTVLLILAGVSILTGVVMALYWGLQGGNPGFGQWTACPVLVAIACVLSANRVHLPEFVAILVVPGLLVVGAVTRLEGLRLFLGRKRFDYRTLLVAVVALALIAYFAYRDDGSPVQRQGANFVVITVVLWAVAGVVALHANARRRLSYRILATLSLAYGAFLLVYAVMWLTGSWDSLLWEVNAVNLAFFVMVGLLEAAWVLVFLALGNERVAERLRAAHSAAETRRSQLDGIIAFLPDATFAMDKDHRVIAWNRAAEELSGVPAELVMGKSYEEGARKALGDNPETLLDLVVDPALPIPERYRDSVREGDTLSAELTGEYKMRPGRMLHLLLAASVLRDANGAVVGAIESMRDISARVQEERMLQQREEQYRSLFEFSLDGILVMAPSGAIADANPAACQMLGMTKEEVRAKGRAGISRPSEETKKDLEGLASPGGEMEEYVFTRKDGTTFPAECMSVVWCDALGVPQAYMVFRDITEQKESQRILRESEAKLVQALDVARVGNWEIDFVGRSVWLSPEALRLYGVETTTNYFPLDKDAPVSYAENPAEVNRAMQSAISACGSYDIEYRIKRVSDGALRVVHSAGKVICDKGGAPLRMSGVIQDITELRQVDEVAGLAQRSVGQAPDQVMWIAADGRFLYVNDSACEQLGYSRDELLGMTVFDVNPTLGDDWPDRWAEAKRRGSISSEAMCRTKEGRKLPLEATINYVEYDGEEFCFVSARDASSRKQVEESLGRSRLSSVQGGDQVFWMSPEGRFVYVNDATCRHLGYSREELLGMTIYDVDPTSTGDWRVAWDEIKRVGSGARETVHRTKDGRDIPVATSINYVEHAGQEYYLVFAREIRDHEREEGLGASEEKLREAHTMEAIGQLAGGIAHDFNSLLTAIIGYGHLILSNEQIQGSTVQKDAEEIRAAAERASQLTRQILAFSRRQALRPRVVALAEVVAEMEPRIRETLGENLELVIQQEGDSGFVEVDTDQFGQVLVNLAANARDAMPGGGRVAMETRNVELGEEYCRAYPELAPGDYVLLSVSDTGAGMSSETMSHIFEPFFTTKGPGTGTGLGLSAVYGIVRQSGGYVLVYSEVDKGTTFKVYLPRVAAAVQPAEEPVAAEKIVRGTETVVVVEDEASLRRLVSRVLGNLGYRVVVAGHGLEALELLESLDYPPSLLLTDVILPGGVQGDEVAREFLAVVPDLPVLYMSGHTRAAIVHSGRIDEGVNFLEKPFTPELLAAKVREVLDSRPR